MRSIVFVLALVAGAYALQDVTVPNTFVDSAIIDAVDFNQNFDTLEAWIARTNDSIDVNFMRFTDLSSHDSTLSYVKVDTIRSNPDIDSIRGLNVMRGNPDIDSISGSPYINALTTTKATADTLNLGESALHYFKRGTFGIKITTAYCTGEVTATARYTVIDSVVMITIPYTSAFGGLTCTSNDNNLNIAPTTAFPSEILPSEAGQAVQCIVYNGGDVMPGFAFIYGNGNPWLMYTVRDGAGADVAGLDYYNSWAVSGTKGLAAQTLIYRR